MTADWRAKPLLSWAEAEAVAPCHHVGNVIARMDSTARRSYVNDGSVGTPVLGILGIVGTPMATDAEEK